MSSEAKIDLKKDPWFRLEQGMMIWKGFYRILNGMYQFFFMSKGMSFMCLFEACIMDGMAHA
jgi:hypothetical protein